jgi:hypothetical protein
MFFTVTTIRDQMMSPVEKDCITTEVKDTTELKQLLINENSYLF